ncbi:MAG: hypothetical protein PUE85_01335 [Firmicutes bacterium]|nr:hypothetical protein [Bacillota bacterium]
MLRYGLFDSTSYTEVNGIRVYNKAQTADFFARYFSSFVGNGVLLRPSANFSVLSSAGMTVQIRPGSAFINGYFAFDDDTEYHTFSSDSVPHDYYAVLRLDTGLGEINLIWITDPEAGSLPERSGDIWDLVVAKVSVPAGASSVTDQMITDLRSDASVCGFVSSLIDGIGAVVDYAETAGGVSGQLGSASLAPGSVTNPKLADMAAKTVKGNIGSSAAQPGDITAAQLLEMLLGTLSGIVKANGSGVLYAAEADADFLSPASKGAAGGVASLDSNAKLSPAQAQSHIVSVTESKTIGSSDAGTMQLVNSEESVTLTFPSGLDVGTELEVCRYGTGTVTLSAALINGSADPVNIANQYGCTALKQVAADQWIAAGDIE